MTRAAISEKVTSNSLRFFLSSDSRMARVSGKMDEPLNK